VFPFEGRRRWLNVDAGGLHVYHKLNSTPVITSFLTHYK